MSHLNPPPRVSGEIESSHFFTQLTESVRLLFEFVRPNYRGAITAGTTQTQAGATVLSGKINNVTVVANASDAIGLPPANGGDIEIVNNGANAAAIWPASGDAIDGGAANAVDANTLAAGASRRYLSTDDDNWITLSNG